MEENLEEVRAGRQNSSITLEMVRTGKDCYRYDSTNTVSEGVKVVQKALHMYGFNLSADGMFGSQTMAVVNGFQLENNLALNGNIDKETLLKLESWCGTLYEVPPSSPAFSQIQCGLATLRSGNSGKAVDMVRDLLRQHKYLCALNGNYDSALETVVKQFQTDKGIPVTGNVDQVTLAVLQDLTADTAWLNGSTVNLTPGKLAQAGFFGILIQPSVVTDINKGLSKYGITTGEKVLHFLAQVMEETSGSENIMENNYRPGDGYIGQSNYSPYCGAGVLQMTWADAYERFSKYVNDPSNGYSPDPNIYPGQLGGNGMYATQHVALKYPGTSAAWFWDQYKKINDSVDWNQKAKEISYAITKKIFSTNASTTILDKRYQRYLTIHSLLKYK